ncbi:type I CRISPR-associated protein Cas7 [Neolewinella litorea]|uniref:CRISPR-associated protein n=1 Tax=Neolewinella litorea TaxID=2562452 RepID=A0A4S4NPA8_9BACT|nr:type I CRISPR-associated protein Cas7 [Neolewinella litorea]THH40241.1 CRISPR-associated protein [Neolewinella litorea]
MNQYSQRAYGCAIIKAVNSNYNADFSHRPRTLPDGTAYATDKALKYLIRNHWVQHLTGERDYVLYWKRYDDNLKPFGLDDSYEHKFSKIEKKTSKTEVIKNLLDCLDVRTFGATFASKNGVSMSLHGPLQISHGLNRYPVSEVYAEQIGSPFANNEEGKNKKEQTTLGTQYKIDRAYYAHHLSLNPSNLTAHYQLDGIGATGLTGEDVEKIKEGVRKGPTYYDSTAKSGTETALLLWVTLKDKSQLVLPSFVELVQVSDDETIDLQLVTDLLAREGIKDAIERVEVYHEPSTAVINLPAGAELKNLI